MIPFTLKNNTAFLTMKNGEKQFEILLDQEDLHKFLNFPFSWKVEMKQELPRVFTTASSKGKTKIALLENYILNCNSEEKVIFKNKNTLDFRKSNLEKK